MSVRARLTAIGIVFVVLVVLVAVVLGVWAYRVYDSPATGTVSTWPFRSGGFVRFQADEDRISYILVSELDEEDVSITTTTTQSRGVVDMRCSITTTAGQKATIAFGRKPRLILVGRDGSVIEGACPMIRRDLADLERLFRDAAEKAQGKADSVTVFLEYVRSRPDLDWPSFVEEITRDPAGSTHP